MRDLLENICKILENSSRELRPLTQVQSFEFSLANYKKFDLARPVFVDRPPAERLDYSDAEFVDVRLDFEILFFFSSNLWKNHDD